MKRSEMIEKIVEDLEALEWSGFETISNQDAADIILTTIEKSGMLPPSIGIENRGSPSCLYTYDCFCGGHYDEVEIEDFCKWESEDE